MDGLFKHGTPILIDMLHKQHPMFAIMNKLLFSK